jgi:hypothetical protein
MGRQDRLQRLLLWQGNVKQAAEYGNDENCHAFCYYATVKVELPPHS